MTKAVVTNQFRIGLYPFIQYLYSYFPLTSSINGSTTNSSTINYAAANLPSLLDTNMNANLGSGGTHIDTAITSMNGVITSVGNGSTSTNTLPYVFLITDGAQDPQTKGVPNGGWAGSNHATTIDPAICNTMKNRGIKISVLYTPYVTINPVNASFAGDEDDAANNNIPNIPGQPFGLRVAIGFVGQLFLHREHAAGHQQRADGDVQARADGRAHHQLIGLSHLEWAAIRGDAACIAPIALE